ncbi:MULTISPECIES: phytochelatin synthase family protein [Ensifer]|uniref:glutathione gamma-glutamylcysteinyltransferase n=1 Tax=Ensifer canadensis TaxID=555315 RepID=A0AAW4FI24_9HYPH|nr:MULTISPECIES: phytochelatin synthase family protein [Ensifer]MDP9629493.1 hypothetical protein [Ensifer adhaerens]KQW50151.1 phytochelatin synthase [Ensifer sp. Root1252]KQY62911.1 phytochelatin synthase [Ensifer sp. Root142]KRC74375.1 phytochelatin synthase [Ensifer sp. Root231]KRD03088.1 phytochelatin synthase [Ensifer sp. Root258]
MKHRVVLGFAAALGLLVAATFVVPSRTSVAPIAIETSVIRSSDLLEKAWSLPVASAFDKRVTWQSNGSRCGPASLANSFRSIGEDETTEADVLSGTGTCWTGYCIMGLTLDELAELARKKTSHQVTVLRNLTAEQFREHMTHANDPDRRYIINFDRRTIFGAGAGHHSPVAGYLEAEDLVFVLDVNEQFKPWLIERDRLFAAMDTLDGDSKRGLLQIGGP